MKNILIILAVLLIGGALLVGKGGTRNTPSVPSATEQMSSENSDVSQIEDLFNQEPTEFSDSDMSF